MNDYIKSLVTPQPTKTVVSRRVKSFDVEMLRLFAVAQLAEGNITSSVVSYEAIGAPYRLATTKDGMIRFSQSGKPSVRVAKDIVTFGTMIHNNIVAGIQADTARVFKEREDACNSILADAEKAGRPVIESDEQKLADALALRAEAEAKAAEADRVLVPA